MQQRASMTDEQQRASQTILRNMAHDLIEQYFLPTVGLRERCHSRSDLFFCAVGHTQAADGRQSHRENVAHVERRINRRDATRRTASESAFVPSSLHPHSIDTLRRSSKSSLPRSTTVTSKPRRSIYGCSANWNSVIPSLITPVRPHRQHQPLLHLSLVQTRCPYPATIVTKSSTMSASLINPVREQARVAPRPRCPTPSTTSRTT